MSVKAIALFFIATSGVVDAASVSSLMSAADAIVVGTESAPLQSGNAVTFYLTVERVFKGGVQTGSVLNVTWYPRTKLGVPDGSPSIRGIWFLRKAANGSWESIPAAATGNADFFPDLSLPVCQGALPAQLAYNASATPLADQILLEVAGGVPRANSRLILNIASEVNSPGAVQAFRYLASQSSNQRLIGLAGLIEAGDTNGLLAVEAMSGHLTAGAPGADLIASAIKLHFRSADPAAIAALGRMATSNEASSLVKLAAAQTLAAIHGATAVPWLGLLLNGSDVQMQAYGAQGLSYFANGVGIPTPQTMPRLDHLNQRQPSAYRTPDTDQHIGYAPGQVSSFIQYWQGWWTQHPELHQ